VIRVGRLALLPVAAALVCGGLASAVLAASPSPRTATTTASTTTTSATTTSVSTAPSVLAFTGHGWGHGLGLSQFGAYGYAQHGWTYDRILAHYYPGTTLGAAKVTTVRVLLAQEKKVTLSSPVPWTLTDASGVKTQLPARDLTLGAALSVDGVKTAPPLTFAAKLPLLVDGRAYRGKLVLTTDGKLVDVVDGVGLEQYVKGVVPSEMPSAWATEALKAQAVAARSYALANLAKGRPFDLYGDTRSQVYGGVAAEAPTTSAAVDATKGQVVLYGGKVADTLFFSTSGGRTASSLESTGIAVPYLVPVADPYDTLSPYHDWGPVLVDAAAAARALKLAAPIQSLVATNGPSGRVKTVAVTTADDAVVTLTGNQVRTALGLRSTWFAPALLQLLPAARTITYGGAVSLGGAATGADGVTLESKPSGQAAWLPGAALVPRADGSFAIVVKPQLTTWYRLAWGSARAGLAKIAVAARVTATVAPASVQGAVRPVAASAPVQLQERETDGSWATVSSTATDASSAFSFAGALLPGTYRVRAAPGHGIVAGVSATFDVS
jgi:stage II sporulation protein D